MTKLIGILNITPDSFSDGGKFDSTLSALAQARQLFADGAHWVDVGAESTRPGAKTIKIDDEWNRMTDFWQAVKASDDLELTKFSLDTRNPETAEKFLKLGGRIINNVSGFQDREMIMLAAKYDATCIVNHFPGTTVEEVHAQQISSLESVKDDLLLRATEMMKQGIGGNKIILDPGIGFGKTEALNWELLEFAALVPDWPVLIGHSKKRFLGEDRFKEKANVGAAQKALATGAAYLRVHEPEWYY